jgi:hypothetical protein
MTEKKEMSHSGIKVLMVDDRPENLLALEATLEPLGLHLIKALSGEDALRHLLRSEFAVILIDVQMPGMNGFELAVEIRKSPRFRDVPVIFLTAINKSDAHVAQGYAEGAVDYLFKPLVPEILRAKVAIFAELYKKSVEIHRHKEQLARLVSALNRSNEELSQFAYVASHDLQEPLRKISAFAERLTSHLGSELDETGRDFLMRMSRAVEGMQNLVDSLLRLAKLTSAPPSFTDVDLNLVARQVLTEMETSVSESGAKVTVEKLPRVRADGTQMRQLLQNLVSNAIKFRRRGKSPKVRVYARNLGGGLCEICVQDDGVGFDPKEADAIFEPFKRLHSRFKFQGTGIGLAVCRKIAQRHQGSITAESVPDRGSLFKVVLPLSRKARVTWRKKEKACG